MTAETRVCLSCNKTIRGRIDKKFCTDICRNTYNNRLNSDSNSYIRNINLNLRKNRLILRSFLRGPQNTRKVPKHFLSGKGYRFRYFTHTFTNRQGRLFHCCYEYGYRILEKDHVLIMRRKKKETDEV